MGNMANLMNKGSFIGAAFLCSFPGSLGLEAAAPPPPCHFTWFPSNDCFQKWDSFGDHVELGAFISRPPDPLKAEDLHTSILDSPDPAISKKSPRPKPRLWELAACSASAPGQQIRLPYPAPIYRNGDYADGPHLFWVGWNGPFPDAAHLQKLSALGEGTFLCALLADGIRCSNVVQITIRSDYDPTREPVVRVAALQPFRGKEIQQVGLWIVPPTPPDRNLTNFAAAEAQLEINGNAYGGQMAWEGPVDPLSPGTPFPQIISWTSSRPPFSDLNRTRVRAKLADPETTYFSAETELLNDGTTDYFDHAFAP